MSGIMETSHDTTSSHKTQTKLAFVSAKAASGQGCNEIRETVLPLHSISVAIKIKKKLVKVLRAQVEATNSCHD